MTSDLFYICFLVACFFMGLIGPLVLRAVMQVYREKRHKNEEIEMRKVHKRINKIINK